MHYETNVPLASMTTLHVGGPARYLAHVTTVKELAGAFSFAREKNLPVFVLGGGSNILVDDAGFDGMVVKMEIVGVEFFKKRNGTVEAAVGAGENWDDFVAETVRRGLFGLENLSGIPGLVGAAPIQNIGAYGAEVSRCITAVDVFDPAIMVERAIGRDECRFAYRDSIFKTPDGKRLVVTSVHFNLFKDGTLDTSYKDVSRYFEHSTEKPTLRSVRDAVLSIRSAKFPDMSRVGTAGSFFKNPIISPEKAHELKQRFPALPQFPAEGGVKVSIAWILDHILNYKGKEVGAVGTFKNHSLVLMNNGGAHASGIDAFAKEIERNVKEKTGIILEREVTTVQSC